MGSLREALSKQRCAKTGRCDWAQLQWTVMSILGTVLIGILGSLACAVALGSFIQGGAGNKRARSTDPSDTANDGPGSALSGSDSTAPILGDAAEKAADPS
jgi:hypothetical protein